MQYRAPIIGAGIEAKTAPNFPVNDAYLLLIKDTLKLKEVMWMIIALPRTEKKSMNPADI